MKCRDSDLIVLVALIFLIIIVAIVTVIAAVIVLIIRVGRYMGTGVFLGGMFCSPESVAKGISAEVVVE